MKKHIKECLKKIELKFKASVHAVVEIAKETPNAQLINPSNSKNIIIKYKPSILQLQSSPKLCYFSVLS